MPSTRPRIRSSCAPLHNADQHLWPGQFVNITLVIGNDADAIVVPDAAVKAGPNGNYVFVVKADNSAEQRAVSVARTVASEAVIEKGLSAGETVVTDGQSRLVDGTRVKVTDSAVADVAENQKIHHEGTKDTK
jgi:RND family efflux transporter, MFP subunit